jgi:hypothetical protein
MRRGTPKAGTALDGSLARWKCRRRSQSGTGIWSGQDPAFLKKQGTGHAGIHWNRRAPGRVLAHALPLIAVVAICPVLFVEAGGVASLAHLAAR